ncbi:hypothetical protein MTF65_13840 [Streptomyces sp. APSN-46.1]|uniref:hypothetical protein n=1 Tax=Streptomyces sp. APSN-46.1 TaxID=2929049 RepID=UPI001FB4B75E|nr:hypothetical protein [Streptomyces sp. APSN-46.1]MCJ1678410.1 hypothetical protein [Streptomyces sp. APSN-46.1]
MGPYQAWIDLHVAVLSEAKARGELLPNVDPVVPSRMIVGAYAGLNMMSQVLDLDLDEQVAALYTHVMPNIVVPAVAIRLDTAVPPRGGAPHTPRGTRNLTDSPNSPAGADRGGEGDRKGTEGLVSPGRP